MKLDLSSVREFDGADIVQEVYGSKQDLTEEDVASLVDFVSMRAQSLQSRIIIKLNQQVSESIEDLASYDMWPNLGRIAEHALEEEHKCLKRDKSASRIGDIIELTRLRLKFLQTGIQELPAFIEELQSNPIIQESLNKHRKG